MDSNHNQQQQQSMNSGLTRYRSAPSSYFSNLITTGMYEQDQDFTPFFNSMASIPQTEHIVSNLDQYMDSMKQQQQQHMIYRNHEQAQKAVVNHDSVGMNLLRQSSSPPGFFQQNNMDNGYSMMRSIDNIRRVNGSVPDLPSDKRQKSRMARIPENEGKISNGGSWDESGMLNDEFMKEYGENNRINSSKGRIHASTGLTHQLSLPTSSNELSGMENFMQFQDGVPLRSRAKRGCATHPRSIAERVRRTRISERMRRLQDLVPNMDKQTNTADMLDLAVDYIKELQKQAVTLSEHRANCTCPHKQKLS